MITVKNEKIDISVLKNGKELKKFTIKNTLTDQFLDMVLYSMLPASIANVLFPDITISALTYSAFSMGAFDFTTPKQSLDITDTTANYTEHFHRTTTEVKYLDNGKEILSIYNETTFSEEDLLQYLIFFSTEGAEERLTSFIDVSSLLFYGDNADIQFKVTRYDKITSNETPLLPLSLAYDFLPRLEDNAFSKVTISQIVTCSQVNGIGNIKSYNITDLSFEKISAGIVEITGFDNYLIEDNILLCATTTICGTGTIITQNAEKIKSVRFVYSNGTQTYVNIEDLDVSYSDKIMKLRLKCERSDY